MRIKGRGAGCLYLPTYTRQGKSKRSGIWWWKCGRIRVSTGCRRLRDAQAWQLARLAEMGRGSLVGLRATQQTYESAETALRNQHAVDGRRASLACQLAHLRSYFSGWRATDITPAACRDYAARRRHEGAAVATVNLELARLRRGLRLLWQSGLIPAAPHVPMLPGANVRRGWLELADVDAILACLPARCAPPVRFLALTGWRLGEALGLEWSRVHRDAREIRLDTSKSGDPRCLPYGTYPALEAVIEAQWRGRSGLCPWVFPGRALRPLYRGTVERHWRAACEATGHRGALIHDLRRSLVRRMEAAGVPRHVAMSITGHRSEQVYLRYAITDRSAQEDGLALLSAQQERAAKVQRIG